MVKITVQISSTRRRRFTWFGSNSLSIIFKYLIKVIMDYKQILKKFFYKVGVKIDRN